MYEPRAHRRSHANAAIERRAQPPTRRGLAFGGHHSIANLSAEVAPRDPVLQRTVKRGDTGATVGDAEQLLEFLLTYIPVQLRRIMDERQRSTGEGGEQVRNALVNALHAPIDSPTSYTVLDTDFALLEAFLDVVRAALGLGPELAQLVSPVAEASPDQSEASSSKRKRTARDEPEEIEDKLLGVLGSGQGRVKSKWFDDARVHKIIKGNIDLACWNWALRGLSDEGGPSPEQFWNYILESGAEEPAWLRDVPDNVKGEIVDLTRRIAKARLSKNKLGLVPTIKGPSRIALARQMLIEACRQIVALNGFDIVDDAAAAAHVVCHYKFFEGVVVPEHWWIELPGGIVIQTVPGQNLEVGGPETVFHVEGGQLPEEAEDYGQIRIPVKALKSAQVNILRAGMAKRLKIKQ